MEETDVDLSVLAQSADESGQDGGVAHGRLLLHFTNAVVHRDTAALPGARQTLSEAMGAEAVVDAAAVIAAFEGNDRVADATGIPLDQGSEEPRRQVAAALGVSDNGVADD